MAAVQRFDHSMIERYLRARSLKFLRDSDGDFIVQFSYNDEMGCSVDMYLMVQGQQKDIYSVWGVSDRRIPKNDWGKAIMLCNEWNKLRRWPKAYLYVKDPATDTTGSIRLEYQIDLEEGIHQELFDDFTSSGIDGTFAFWKWAHQEQGL